MKKMNGMAKKILLVVMVIVIGAFLSKYLVESQTEKVAESLINKLDKGLAERNKALPEEIAPNVVLEEVRREDKAVYQTHTLKNIMSSTVNSELIKQDEINMLSRFCNLKGQKELILDGYSFVFVYNTADKKNAFQVIADKNTCSKYTKI